MENFSKIKVDINSLVDTLDKKLDIMIDDIKGKSDSVLTMTVNDLKELNSEMRIVIRTIKSAKYLIKITSPGIIKKIFTSIKDFFALVKAIIILTKRFIVRMIKSLKNKIKKSE